MSAISNTVPTFVGIKNGNIRTVYSEATNHALVGMFKQLIKCQNYVNQVNDHVNHLNETPQVDAPNGRDIRIRIMCTKGENADRMLTLQMHDDMAGIAHRILHIGESGYLPSTPSSDAPAATQGDFDPLLEEKKEQVNERVAQLMREMAGQEGEGSIPARNDPQPPGVNQPNRQGILSRTLDWFRGPPPRLQLPPAPAVLAAAPPQRRPWGPPPRLQLPPAPAVLAAAPPQRRPWGPPPRLQLPPAPAPARGFLNGLGRMLGRRGTEPQEQTREQRAIHSLKPLTVERGAAQAMENAYFVCPLSDSEREVKNIDFIDEKIADLKKYQTRIHSIFDDSSLSIGQKLEQLNTVEKLIAQVEPYFNGDEKGDFLNGKDQGLKKYTLIIIRKIIQGLNRGRNRLLEKRQAPLRTGGAGPAFESAVEAQELALRAARRGAGEAGPALVPQEDGIVIAALKMQRLDRKIQRLLNETKKLESLNQVKNHSSVKQKALKELSKEELHQIELLSKVNIKIASARLILESSYFDSFSHEIQRSYLNQVRSYLSGAIIILRHHDNYIDKNQIEDIFPAQYYEQLCADMRNLKQKIELK